MARRRRCALMLMVLALTPCVTEAWHSPGHRKATAAAVAAVAGKLPDFFVSGAKTVAHCSVDPDTFRRPIAPQALSKGESPEHYFDIELLAGSDVPADRYAFIALCAKRGLQPARVGLLPYAIVEWTGRLTVALAEHRKWPANPQIRTKCLIYAGILSHYAQDLCQPLHCTVHYDGRADKSGESPRTGIHLKVDALLGKCRIKQDEIIKDLPARPFERLFEAVVSEIRRSNAIVDEVYELEGELPALDEPIRPGSRVDRFTRERLRAAAAFSAGLYLTAWQDSRAIKLPDWHKREHAETMPREKRRSTGPAKSPSPAATAAD